MYLHNYYKNPAFYDIYDYDWNNNDPGQIPDPHPSLRDRIGGGGMAVARVPDEIQNGSLESMFFVHGWQAEAECENSEDGGGGCTDEDLNAYANITDKEILSSYNNMLNSNDDIHGGQGQPEYLRNEYLNEETTGYIELNIEEPYNFQFIGDLNPDHSDVHDYAGPTDEQVRIWVEGLIRRIQLLKTLLPKAKLGIWTFSSTQRDALGGDHWTAVKDRMKFAARVTYGVDDQTLYEAVDFLCPTFYNRRSPSTDPASVHMKIVNGVRTDRVKDLCDELVAEHGEKPVIPIMSFNYEVPSTDPMFGQQCFELNAIEIVNLRNYASHFIMWHSSHTALRDDFDANREILLDAISDIDPGYRSRVYPQGWSTDEKALTPMGADRSPPWHQISVPFRYYNNQIVSSSRVIGWEHIPHTDPGEFGTPEFIKGTDKINSYNTGMPCAIPITDNYLIVCGHCIADGTSLRSDVKYWVFMNPVGDMFKVTRKELKNMTSIACEDCCDDDDDCETGTCINGDCIPSAQDIIYGDSAVVEIDSIEKITVSDDGRELIGTGNYSNTMSDIGCPPITKSAAPSSSDIISLDKDLPIIWGPDRQGRSAISINRNVDTTLMLHTAAGINGNSPCMFPEYINLHNGDSGTAIWVNTKNGYIYLNLAAGGGFITNPGFIDFVRELFVSDYDVESVDVSIGSEYEAIDYFEHPDIEYSQSPSGGEDADSNTFIPVIPNQTLKVKSEFIDEQGKELVYTTESNEIETEYTEMLVEPATAETNTVLDINGIAVEFDQTNTLYSDGLDRILISVNYTNETAIEREDFKVPSFEEDFGDSWMINLNGLDLSDVPIVSIGTPKLSTYTTSGTSSSTSKIFSLGSTIIPRFDYEDFEDWDSGTPYSLTLKYENTRTTPHQQETFDIGDLIFTHPPENITLEWDDSQIYPDNEFTINLVTSNVPVPDLTFEVEDGSPITVLFPDAQEFVSSTSTSLTYKVTGNVGDQIALSIPVFWGFDQSVNRIIYHEQLTFIATISSTPDLIVSLTIDPDVDSDGFADTYEDTLKIITNKEESEIEQYKWTMTLPPWPIQD